MNIKKGDLSGFSLVGNHFKQEETGRKTIFAGNILQTGKPNGKTSLTIQDLDVDGDEILFDTTKDMIDAVVKNIN